MVMGSVKFTRPFLEGVYGYEHTTVFDGATKGIVEPESWRVIVDGFGVVGVDRWRLEVGAEYYTLRVAVDADGYAVAVLRAGYMAEDGFKHTFECILANDYSTVRVEPAAEWLKPVLDSDLSRSKMRSPVLFMGGDLGGGTI